MYFTKSVFVPKVSG